MAYAKQREQFGKPLAGHQAIQFMLADMAMHVDAARLLVRKAAVLQDLGESSNVEASRRPGLGAASLRARPRMLT